MRSIYPMEWVPGHVVGMRNNGPKSPVENGLREMPPFTNVDLDSVVSKVGVRALGVAESFRLGLGFSILAGVVMRGDFVIDGAVVGRSTVGGLDATESVINMFKSLGRNDVQLIMLDGCVVSWYNIIDIEEVGRATGLPVICLSFEEPEGDVEGALRKLFSDAEARLSIYRKLGKPQAVPLGAGLIVFVRLHGIDYKAARALIRRFTREGKRPEPIRVARLLANAVLRGLATLNVARPP